MTDEVSLADLLDLLDLKPERGSSEADGSRAVFWARAQPEPADRVFGGLLLAQSLVAAGRTALPSTNR